MKSKSKLKSALLKSIPIVITLAMVAFVAYYVFHVMGGESKIFNDFQAWSKENLFLACLSYLILVPIINIIPGISSMFFIAVANMMLNDQTVKGLWFSFLLADAGVMLSTALLFLLGRIAGKKVIGWIVGKEDFDQAQYFLTVGGKACLPFVYLLPFLPDDALSFACGCTKMKFSYNMICAVLFRSVGVFAICFLGSDPFDYASFTPIQWVLFFGSLILLVVIILLMLRSYYRYLRKKSGDNMYLLTRGIKVKKKKNNSDK